MEPLAVERHASRVQHGLFRHCRRVGLADLANLAGLAATSTITANPVGLDPWRCTRGRGLALADADAGTGTGTGAGLKR